jgi:RNA polymerase sigma-70 factor (ECF subfamily)
MTGSRDARTARFDALFRAHHGDMVAYCGRRSATASDAQDAVAEVFLTAWRRLDDVPAGDAARAWLFATAARVIANQRRATRRRAALEDRLAGERAAGAPEPFASGPADELVHAALRRLPPGDREVLLLAEWDGLRPGEIAAVLGCRAVTARGRLHRARRRFQAAFEDLRAEAEPARADRPVPVTDPEGARR